MNGLPSDDRIQGAEQLRSNDLSSEERLREVAGFPLSQSTILKKLGWWLFLIVGIAAAYVIGRQMPGLPEIVFYPILVVVLFLELVLMQWLFGMRLNVASRFLVYGPVWARKKCPFAEIMAVQLLEVLKIAKRKAKKTPRVFEINIVVSPSRRVPFATNKEKEKARNIAQYVSDVVKAPVVEQLFVEGAK